MKFQKIEPDLSKIKINSANEKLKANIYADISSFKSNLLSINIHEPGQKSWGRTVKVEKIG